MNLSSWSLCYFLSRIEILTRQITWQESDMKEKYWRAVLMQSIPILCHQNPVIVHALCQPESIPALPAMWPFCTSFLLDLFLWNLSEHWPWAVLRAAEGRSSWVEELPTMTRLTPQPCRMHKVTTVHSSCLGADWGRRSSYWFTSGDKTRDEPIPLCASCCAN